MAALGILGAMGAIIGGIVAVIIFHDGDAFWVGAVLGFLFCWNITLSRALGRVEERLRGHDGLFAATKSRGVPAPLESKRQTTSVADSVDDELPVVALGDIAEDIPQPASLSDVPPPSPQPVTSPLYKTVRPGERLQPSPAHHPGPDSFDRVLGYIKAFFTEGNVVLRVGLLVLFFGVAFLLKYASERSLLPIELRLTGVVLAGLAMLVFGWRLREDKPGFALLVQGGGIGLLFLTVFAAAKLYGLLPMPLSFAIMIGLVCTSAALALLQDAKSLALFGATGGFLAPVLLSTGSGSHVALFSYYALLNTGILAIAWFKAWRELNLLGFVFTLGIGSIWGARSYQPQFFATTEPFLILYFLMFSIIAVLFAFRQPPQLRGYVDSSLVFGTPIICFSLQAALVKDMQYGMAISALVVSLFYVGLATLLWNKGDKKVRAGMRTLTEAFLALGVVFVTLAVPLALSGHWTAVTWAMEGAALVWVGVRQNRLIPRNFGVLLQVGAALFFMDSAHFHSARTLIFNGVFLGGVVISMAALFSSWYLYRADNLRSFEKYHHLLLFIWGVLWWFGTGINELDQQLVSRYENHVILLFIGVSCLGMMALVPRLAWPLAAYPSLGLLPVMALVVLENMGWHGASSGRHLFADYGYLAWPAVFGLLYRCFFLGRDRWPDRLLRLSHIGAFLLLVLVVASEAAWQVNAFTYGAGSWTRIVWGLIPVAFVKFIHRSQVNMYWPLSDYGREYQERASAIILSLVWVWLLAGCFFSRGSATPLPFIPVFNPLEISQLMVMLVMLVWSLGHRQFVTGLIAGQTLATLGGVTVFIWINAVLARAIHQLRGVRFDPHHMFDSRYYQASVAILWCLISLVLMVSASRRRSRTIWFVGSGLIGVTVAKLFFVDLAQSGTIERIVSFLAVGVLLMVIGYFSPLPPLRKLGEEKV
ncbi:MAG: DUF2339 domain-containing protein [Proteobacteria bacterium]|nr:DUF2339 domain-containing protein [Pseudomonadota bacterium]